MESLTPRPELENTRKLTEQTILEVFEAERPKLVPYAGRFDGFKNRDDDR